LDSNLLALAVEAARARATLGEISDALERAFGRYHTAVDPVRGIYGQRSDARWKGAVEGTQAVAQRLGRKPRILVAKMGQDGHDRGANLVSSAFGDLGFEVIAGPLFQTPREAAELAVESQVDVVGASSLAAGHKTLIPELIDTLKDMAAPTSRWSPAGSSHHRIMQCSARRASRRSSGRARTWRTRRMRCCGCSGTIGRRSRRRPDEV
jgi:methylmalonyl-CoA mutase